MTDDRARKKAVRRRMAQTGEKYTEARRALDGAPSSGQAQTEQPPADLARRGEFGRFTDGARRVVVLAREEAGALQHDAVGSQHLLLGLLREQDGIAARVLASLHITLERVRAAVVQRAGTRDRGAPGQLQFTPGAKEVLELALREALWLGDNYIGTEHILLGLALETEGVAAGILLDFNADSKTLRSKVIGDLSGVDYRPPSEAGAVRHGGGMFERFTERARTVIELARRESRELGHDHVGGDHILLGLLREPGGIAGRALEALGVTLEQARAGVLERVPRGKPASTGQPPFTPRANQIIELALREALMLRHNYIGTEHILLGLIRDGKSNATDLLVDLDVDPQKVRTEVLNRISVPAADPPA